MQLLSTGEQDKLCFDGESWLGLFSTGSWTPSGFSNVGWQWSGQTAWSKAVYCSQCVLYLMHLLRFLGHKLFNHASGDGSVFLAFNLLVYLTWFIFIWFFYLFSAIMKSAFNPLIYSPLFVSPWKPWWNKKGRIEVIYDHIIFNIGILFNGCVSIHIPLVLFIRDVLKFSH